MKLRLNLKLLVKPFSCFNIFLNGLDFGGANVQNFARKAGSLGFKSLKNLTRFARHNAPRVLIFSAFSLCGDYSIVKKGHITVQGQTRIVRCPDGYAIKIAPATPKPELKQAANPPASAHSYKNKANISIYIRCEDYDIYHNPELKTPKTNFEMRYKHEKTRK